MSPTSAPVPDLINRYFELAVAPDLESYFALFADDATVEDDGTEHHGIAEIRAWRTSVPNVVYSVLDVGNVSGTTSVTAEVAGDFPGSPLELVFEFVEYDEEHIRELRIHT